MNIRNNFKKGMAAVMSAAIVLGMMPGVAGNVTQAQAAGVDKTIAGLGTGVISNPTVPTASSDAWQGSYVYFGTYNGNPVKYRVLDNNTSVFGGTTMLLDCDSILWAGSDPSSKFDDSSNSWSTSYIKRYLNSEKDEGNSYDYSSTGFLTTAFSAAEHMFHLIMIKFSSLMQRK